MTPETIARSGSEHAHQTALFAWAALNFHRWPELKWMFAIPNGGMRDKITAANLKAEGVRAGVPDIFVPIPRGKWHGLFIELKKPGQKAKPSQTEYIAALQLNGYGACVCVGWQAAANIIQKYLDYA